MFCLRCLFHVWQGREGPWSFLLICRVPAFSHSDLLPSCVLPAASPAVGQPSVPVSQVHSGQNTQTAVL